MSRPWIKEAAQAFVRCASQGSTLKQEQVTVVPLHGRSIVTQAGLSGGKQQAGFPIGDVPDGH